MAGSIAMGRAGAAPATAEEMKAVLDRVDRAEAEGQDDGPSHRAAWDALQALIRAAQAGDARALPALRVAMDRRPTTLVNRPLGDVAIEEAARLTAGGDDLLAREGVIRQMVSIRDELAGPGAATLERLLAERVALAWHDAHRVDISAGRDEMAGASPERAEFLSRQRTRAQARFLAAAKSLATVRRLALPVIHVHKEMVPTPAGPLTSRDGLRILSGGAS